jgi:serine/threonine protein kinase
MFRTLRHLIDEGSLFDDPATSWRIFGQILEGLVYIHAQGIIHRDVLLISHFTLTFFRFSLS